MKTFLPTLLPLLGLLVTASSGSVQHFIAAFVSTHPAYATLVGVLGLVLNHWLPSPAELPPVDSSVARRVGSGIGGVLMILLFAGTIGCVSELVKVIDVFQAATRAAGRILTPVNPEYGSQLTVVSGDAGNLKSVLSDFDNAVASAKGDKAAAVRAAASALQTDLGSILQLARVKNPEKVEYVTVFVAIGAEVIAEVSSRLPSSGITAQAEAVPVFVLPRLKDLPGSPTAKSHGDLKRIWNERVGAPFPAAKI